MQVSVRSLSLPLSLGLVLLAACDGDVPLVVCNDDSCKPVASLERLEAILSKAEATAGDFVIVECRAHFNDGTQELATNALLVVTDGLALSEGGVIAQRAGPQEVRCVIGDLRSDPAALNVAPGRPARVRTVLDRTEVQAGETVTADCLIEDEFGNPITGATWTLRSAPILGSTIDGNRVVPELVGDHEVSCLVDALKLDKTNATISVSPGPSAQVFAYVEVPRYGAGERAEVECIVIDAFNNIVPDQATDLTVSPQPVSVDPTGFVAEASGEYWATCHLPSANLSSEPSFVKFTAGLPASMNILDLDPQKAVYALADVFAPVVEVFDVYGNPVEQRFELGLSSLPVTALRDVGRGRAMVLGHGLTTLTAQVTTPTHNNMDVTASIEVSVDGLAPEVTFTFPERAEMVVGNQNAGITITGQVQDPTSGVSELYINGNPVTVSANGNFSAPMSPDWGVNLIEVQTVDGAGNMGEVIQSFEYGGTYRRASNFRTISGRIPDGILARLSDEALDDNASDVDDLARIAQLALQNLDIASLIPNPATTFNSDCSIPFVTIRGALNLHVDSVNYGTPIIDINPRNGGLYMRVEIPNIAVGLRTSGDVCDIGVGVSGTASATRIVVSGNLNVSKSGNQINVSFPNPAISITGLNISLNLPGAIAWAVNGIINLFRGAISNALRNAFRDVIRSQIPPLISNFLESVSLDTGLALPAPLNLTLNVGTGLGTVAFDNNGGTIGLNPTIYTQGTISPEPRGGLLQYNRAAPSFDNSRALGVAISYDLVNQALYSMWYGGGLDIDLTQEGYVPPQLELEGQQVNLNVAAQALLPPVVGPSGDATHPLALQIGDLQLDLSVGSLLGFPPSDITIYAHINAVADASVNSASEITLSVGPNVEVKFQIDAPPAMRLILGPVLDILEIAVTQLLPVIFSQVIQGIPIPNLDLSSLAGTVLPQGIVLGVGNPRISFAPSYLLLEGNVVQVP